ncbi:MAG: Nif11-like leader peptide family RiPP precursor [Planctomycetota bacterium]|nr:Nif11-like leader peptide family RiPP precursor [Planctomycetota bacterium]
MNQTVDERVQAFRDAVNASPELQARVVAGEDWVEIAKAAGHEITAEAIKTYIAARPHDEMSEFELEALGGSVRLQIRLRRYGCSY